MKYFLLYQWPLRPCRNHLNPNMMLAKNLLWNNLMYELINSSPSNFFFYDIETISIGGRIKPMSCQHHAINARTFHSNCDVQILAQKGHIYVLNLSASMSVTCLTQCCLIIDNILETFCLIDIKMAHCYFL